MNYDWVIAVIERIGYWGVFSMIALENLFPPIPSEMILPFTGFMTTKTSMNILGAILAATAGSVLGALILYYIGRLLGGARFDKLIERYGHILRVKPTDIKKANKWYEKYEYKAVLLCRLVPVVRSLISIPAGMSHMKLGAFLLLTTIGSLIWNTVLIVLGAVFGDAWQNILTYLHVYSFVVYIILGIVVIGLAIWFLLKLKKRTTKA